MSPLADPHHEWPVHVAETNAYHNEPRNPYQSEDEDATQAFVQKYLELADIAMRDSSDASESKLQKANDNKDKKGKKEAA
jgi:hypothetical protein